MTDVREVFRCFGENWLAHFVVSCLVVVAVFVQMLNDVSDWTNEHDHGCNIKDDHFLSAYMMFRRTVQDLSSLRSCGVSGQSCSPLQNCPICNSPEGAFWQFE